MKKNILILICCLFCFCSFSQVMLGPKLGINGSKYTTDPDNFKSSFRVGYQFGIQARFGKKVYFHPEFLWHRATSNLVASDSISASTFRDDIKITSFQVPLLLGAYLVDLEAFKWRIETGGLLNFRYKVKSNDLGLQASDFNKVNAVARIGMGFDILVISLDFYYDLGLSEVFSNGSEAKLRALVFDFGLIFKL